MKEKYRESYIKIRQIMNQYVIIKIINFKN